MTRTLTVMLAPGLRQRAEGFFRTAIGDVRLHFGCEAARRGAWAFAARGDVHLDRRVLTLPPRLALEVIGHELAHVLQQRASHRDGTSGRPAGGDALEAEATSLGRAFAAGARPAGPPALAADPRCPQCVVTVGGQTINQVDELAPRTQTVLALIDGAERWLSWAMPSGGAVFRFADDAALATGIQQGLHGGPLLLLDRLQTLVHPRKLLSLDPEQLDQVLAFEGDDGDNAALAATLEGVLGQNGIFGMSQLAGGRQLLAGTGTAEAPLFQCLSLADQIALMDLVRTPPGALALDRKAQAAAAAFAVEAAETPGEFADLYAFYFHVAANAAAANSGTKLPAFVRQTRHTLADLVHPLLQCPTTAAVPTPVDLYALVNRWVDSRQLIGFSSGAAAMRDIAASGVLPAADESTEAFETRLSAFIDAVQQFLKHTEPASRVLSQDGVTHYFALESKAAAARLDRHEDGSVTLGRYQPAAATARARAAGPSTRS